LLKDGCWLKIYNYLDLCAIIFPLATCLYVLTKAFSGSRRGYL